MWYAPNWQMELYHNDLVETLKDTLKAIDDFNNFWYVKKVCTFWKSIQYTLRRDKTQILKKFLSRAPTHHSFTFNLPFLYELKHTVCLSKTVCGIFHFRFRFVLINFPSQ